MRTPLLNCGAYLNYHRRSKVLRILINGNGIIIIIIKTQKQDKYYVCYFYCNIYIFRSAIIDVEPAFTFRGHTGPVLSLAVSSDGEVVYSGSADGQLRMWQTPNDLSDPFDVYGQL